MGNAQIAPAPYNPWRPFPKEDTPAGSTKRDAQSRFADVQDTADWWSAFYSPEEYEKFKKNSQQELGEYENELVYHFDWVKPATAKEVRKQRPAVPVDYIFDSPNHSAEWSKWLMREIRAYYGEMKLVTEELEWCNRKETKRASRACRGLLEKYVDMVDNENVGKRLKHAMFTGQNMTYDPTEWSPQEAVNRQRQNLDF